MTNNSEKTATNNSKISASYDFVQAVESAGVKVSMEGRGRWMDNVFIERFWRSLKYEQVYLHSYETTKEARESIGAWIDFYNNHRPHQALDYKTPAEVHFARGASVAA